jgi:hypothetical protein
VAKAAAPSQGTDCVASHREHTRTDSTKTGTPVPLPNMRVVADLLALLASQLFPFAAEISSTFLQASSFLAVKEARASAYSASGTSSVVMNGQPPELS